LALVRPLTLAHLLLAGVVYLVAMPMYRAQFRRARRTRALQRPVGMGAPVEDSPAGRCFVLIQQATMLRLALLEGAALFGLVVCVIGVLGGVLHRYPLYWVNSVSALIMLGTVVATFPTRERLEQVFRDYIALSA
jgi:hypothetical protein